MYKKLLTTALSVAFVALIFSGCASKPQSASAQEAIDNAKSLQTVEQQVSYLVKEANAFVNSKKFDEAIAAAKYILSNLDQNSADAKSILEKAQAELTKLAQEKAEELKGEVANKLGNLGQK